LTSGDVILLPFPYSDLSGSKLRPAIVLASVGRGDFIACQVTSNADADLGAIALVASSFFEGSLKVNSYARPTKLFTANRMIVQKRVARLTKSVCERIKQVLIQTLQQ